MTKVFRSNPYNELYKVSEFPNGSLQNEEVKNVINKILLDAYDDPDDELFFNDEFWTNEVNMYLSNLSSFETVYVHTSGDGQISIYDSLNYFSAGYRSEEQWSIENWIEF